MKKKKTIYDAVEAKINSLIEIGEKIYNFKYELFVGDIKFRTVIPPHKEKNLGKRTTYELFIGQTIIPHDERIYELRNLLVKEFEKQEQKYLSNYLNISPDMYDKIKN